MKRRTFIAQTAALPLIALPAHRALAEQGYRVEAKEEPGAAYQSYLARTVDLLPGFSMQATDPSKDAFGGWLVSSQFARTGRFHTVKLNGRWWLVDPTGNPFIHVAPAALFTGPSKRSQSALKQKYGSLANWAEQTIQMLQDAGFNGGGGWTSINEIKAARRRFTYCAYIEPMQKFREYLKQQGDFRGKAGWQGYPNDIVRVFDPRFDRFVESEARKLIPYARDPYMIGYFTDNELPWKNDALDRFLTLLPAGDPGHIAAQRWLDARKGRKSTTADIGDSDRRDFLGYYIRTYLEKVTRATRRYAPDRLYLGCRFNQHREELASEAIFREAGKYMDIISINHYHKWQPEAVQMRDWERWAGKPFMITEFYVKGEDTGMANTSGAGWIVKSQAERGYFYQNFIMELLKSRACVGWHWLAYQDNDPEGQSDESNRDSNKGLVTWDYRPYQAALEQMKSANRQIYRLIEYFDRG